MRTVHKHFLAGWLVVLVVLILTVGWLGLKYRYPEQVLTSTDLNLNTTSTEEIGSIDDFSSALTVQEDGTINVQEKIAYNHQVPISFLERRLLSTLNDQGGKYLFPIKDIVVTDEAGRPITFTKTATENGWLLKFQNEGVWPIGRQVINLNYNLARVINFYEDHDELLWPVTGAGFTWPVERIGVLAKLPTQDSTQELTASCLVNKTISDCLISNLMASQVGYSLLRELPKGESLMIKLSWPKGVLTNPAFSARFFFVLNDNPWLLLPVIVLLIMFCLWFFHGRDLTARFIKRSENDTIPPLSPALTGTLADEKFDLRDLTGEFFSLAVRGIVAFKKGEGGWQIVLRQNDNNLSSWDKLLLLNAFADAKEISFGQLRLNLSDSIHALKSELYQFLVIKEYFPESPKKVRNFYTTIAILFLLTGIFMVWLGSGVLNSGSFILTAVIVFWLGQYMPYKTIKGSAVYSQILIYRAYLNSLATTKNIINDWSKHLPYVAIFGFSNTLVDRLTMGVNNWPVWLIMNKPFDSKTFSNTLLEINNSLRAKLSGIFGR